MIKFTKSVREDILEKDIYIWNINRNSLNVFIWLGLELIDVKGFVLPPFIKEFEQKTIMNRPIVKTEDFNNKDNAVLITSDRCVSISEVEFSENICVYKYSDTLAFNKDFYSKNVYLYGAGKETVVFTQTLIKENIEIKGYYVTTNTSADIFKKPTRKYNSNNFSENDAIVLALKQPVFKKEILINLSNAPCDIYISQDDIYAFMESSPIYFIDKVIKNNHKVFLLSSYNPFTTLLIKFFKIYNVSLINKNDYDMNALYDMIRETEEKFIVMIVEGEDTKRVEVLDQLYKLGFSINNRNIISMNAITFHKKHLLKENDYIDDCLLGHGQRYGSDQSCGWKILGEVDKNLPKIIILGGSTSTEDYLAPETWMRKLYKKLNKLNLPCIFYIGSAGAYSALQEFLKFLRDGHLIKPDIVISMSGVNDTAWNMANKFNLKMPFDTDKKNYIVGMPSNENCYETWLRIEKMFKLHVEALDAEFFSFLQPMNFYCPNMTLETHMVNETEESLIGGKDFFQCANDNEIYTNLIYLFHNQPDMFIDDCHYSDKAEDILSDNVLEVILPSVREVYDKF